MWVIGAIAAAAVAAISLTWAARPWLEVKPENREQVLPVLRASSNRGFVATLAMLLTVPLFLVHAPNVASNSALIGALVIGVLCTGGFVTAHWMDPDAPPMPSSLIAIAWVSAALLAAGVAGVGSATKRLEAQVHAAQGQGAHLPSTGEVLAQAIITGWWAALIVGAVGAWHMHYRRKRDRKRRRAANRARLREIEAFAATQRRRRTPPAPSRLRNTPQRAHRR